MLLPESAYQPILEMEQAASGRVIRLSPEHAAKPDRAGCARFQRRVDQLLVALEGVERIASSRKWVLSARMTVRVSVRVCQSPRPIEIV